MNNLNLSNVKSIHFIGIGGIGISSIARMMLLQGKKVSGSDISDSEITKELKRLRAKINIGHKKENLNPKADLVIYTIAIPENNPELVKARKLKIKLLTYPEALGLISKNFYTVAVSGTHGKTTTTAMLAKIFLDAELKPTVVVGGLLKRQKSPDTAKRYRGSSIDFVNRDNFIAGKGKFFIVEACEYKRSFLNLEPKILIITNIDNDHMDYYKNFGDIQKAFSQLVSKIPKDGFLICASDDPKIKPVLKTAKCKILNYQDIRQNFRLKIPGQHNIENAKAAFATAGALNINARKILNSLGNYSGIWRRFDFKGKTKKGALVYDDYAHHPTEIKATLKSFREKFPSKKLMVIFQPHLFSRTKILLNDFAKSFGDADKIIVAPIYAAREKDDGTINSEMLAEKIRQTGKTVLTPCPATLGSGVENFEKIADYLITHTGKNDVIITMGAGDIYKIGERLI